MSGRLSVPSTHPPRDDNEDQRPLLRSFPSPSGYGAEHLTGRSKDEDVSFIEQVHQYLTVDISTRWADLLLLVCFFLSGMIDAGAYNAYENFASMQTGNTIFAALGVSNLPVNAPRLAWVKSVTSIFSFLLGSMAFATYHRKLGQRKRWVMVSAFAGQAVFIAISAYLVRTGRSSGSPPSKGDPKLMSVPADPGFPWSDLIPLGLLSFQASGKVVASRILEYNGLPCVVLTSLYTDLFSDPALFTAGLTGNVTRNRRVGGAVLYFVGAVLGGFAASTDVGFSGALYMAAMLQLLVAVAWTLWPLEESDGDDEES